MTQSYVVVLVILLDVICQVDDALDCILHIWYAKYLSEVSIVLLVYMSELFQLLTGVVIRPRRWHTLLELEFSAAVKLEIYVLLVRVYRIHFVQLSIVAVLVGNDLIRIGLSMRPRSMHVTSFANLCSPVLIVSMI